MPLIYVSLLLIIAAFATADHDCNRKIHETCDPRDVPGSFPENEEELNAGCRAVIRFFECKTQVVEDCMNSEEARQINSMLSVIRNVCDEDSRLHRVVADNLQCLKPVLTRDVRQCTVVHLNEEKLEKHLDILSDQGVQPFAEVEHIRDVCRMDLYSAACVGVKIGKKCGSSALDAYIEIVQQYPHLFVEECKEQITEYLPAYIEVLMLEEAEVEETREAFRRKKK